MKKVLVLMLVVMICALSFVSTNAYALTIQSITATPDTPGAIAAYTAQITTTQPLTATSDYVRIVFPSTFTVPSSINASSISVNEVVPYSVTASGTTGLAFYLERLLLKAASPLHIDTAFKGRRDEKFSLLQENLLMQGEHC